MKKEKVIWLVLIAGAIVWLAWYWDDSIKANPPDQTNQIPISTVEALTPGNPRDLRTYRNEKFGFQFQYPADLLLYEDGTQTRSLIPQLENVRLVSTNTKTGQDFYVDINITALDIVILDRIRNGDLGLVTGEKYKILDEKTVYLDGVEMKQQSIFQKNLPDNPKIWLSGVYKDKIFHIGFGLSKNTSKAIRGLSEAKEKILSTFKFLN